MDILYVVGRGSQWRNNELLYSLRSIDVNCINIGRVYLVGYKPDFVNDEIIHIPCNDIYNRKHKNILYKVITAINKSDISSHFLISSDDHYYLQPTDFESLPIYYKHRVINTDNIPANDYSRSLIQTRKLLEKYSLPVFQTNPHCNTHFDTDIYRRYKSIFDECFKLKYGGEMNCVMGNLLISEGSEPLRIHDLKIADNITKENWENKIADAHCVSSVDGICRTYLAQYLVEHFPNKSKYEK